MDLTIKHIDSYERRLSLSQGHNTFSSKDSDLEFNFINTTKERSSAFSGFKHKRSAEIKDILLLLEKKIEDTHKNRLSPEEIYETKKIISDWIITNLKNIEIRIKSLNNALKKVFDQTQRAKIEEEIKLLQQEQFNSLNLPKKITYNYDIPEEEIEAKIPLKEPIESNPVLPESIESVQQFYDLHKAILLESAISIKSLQKETTGNLQQMFNILRTSVIENTYNKFRKSLSLSNISKEQSLELALTNFKQVLDNMHAAVIADTYHSYKYFFTVDLIGMVSNKISLELWQEKARNNFENTLADMHKQIVKVIYKKYDYVFNEFPMTKLKEIIEIDFDLTIEALYIIINFHAIDSWISERETINSYSPHVALPASPSYARTLMLSNRQNGQEIGVYIPKPLIKDGLKKLFYVISSEKFRAIEKDFVRPTENLEINMALINLDFKNSVSSMVNKCSKEMNVIINSMLIDIKQIQNLVLEHYLLKNQSIYIKISELAETSLASYYNYEELNSFELDLYTFNSRVISDFVKFWLTTRAIDFTKHEPIIYILNKLPEFREYHETLKSLSNGLIYDILELAYKFTKLADTLSQNDILILLKEHFEFTLSYLKNMDNVIKLLTTDKKTNKTLFNLVEAEKDLTQQLKTLHYELITNPSYNLNKSTAKIYADKMKTIIASTYNKLKASLYSLIDDHNLLEIIEPEYYRNFYNYHFPKNNIQTAESEHYQKIRISATEMHFVNSIKEKQTFFKSKCGVINFFLHNAKRKNAKDQLDQLEKVEKERNIRRKKYIESEKTVKNIEEYFKYMTETESEVLLLS
jgi:hypothetical protein